MVGDGGGRRGGGGRDAAGAGAFGSNEEEDGDTDDGDDGDDVDDPPESIIRSPALEGTDARAAKLLAVEAEAPAPPLPAMVLAFVAADTPRR